MKDDDLMMHAAKAQTQAQPWKSGTRVGCAIEAEDGTIVTGFNIEGLWMTSLHAEVVAITELVRIRGKGKSIAIKADAQYFTPCGACLDWLFQFCNKNSKVYVENPQMELFEYTLRELCPHYPTK